MPRKKAKKEDAPVVKVSKPKVDKSATLREAVRERWSNDGAVTVDTTLDYQSERVQQTLEKLLDSPHVESYVPLQSDEKDGALAEVQINFVRFKIRKNVKVILPVQVMRLLAPNPNLIADNFNLRKNPDKLEALT